MDCGLLHAQPPPPPPPQDIGAPIDNDAALLLIIVAVYGTIKIYNKKHTSIKPIL